MIGGVTARAQPSAERDRTEFVRKGLLLISAVLMLASLYLIFLWVPTEQNLGVVQRIFYFHVPVAWVAFLAFFVVFIASIQYLRRGSEAWDALAHSAAEIGVLLASLMIVTGSIWAKPIWGVWWTWDPRLTTSLMLWLIYVAYLMLRAYAPHGSQGARFAAVLGIIGFVDVPIVYLSIVWWRTVHPQAVVGPAAEPGSLASSMLLTLMVSLVTFTVLFAYLLMERYTLKRAEMTLDRLHQINV